MSDPISAAIALFNAPIDAPAPALTAELETLLRSALAYRVRSLSPNTIRAYLAHWHEFRAYCTRHNFDALPTSARALELYLAWCADYRHHEKNHEWWRAIEHNDKDICPTSPPLRIASIQQRLAAIATVHRLNDLPSPTEVESVQKTLTGIVNVHTRERGGRQRVAITKDDLRELVAPLSDDLIDIRDRAILLTLFLGALRRSELAALAVSDITLEQRGMVITLRHSKTNQHGRGGVQRIAIKHQHDPALDAARSYKRWLQRSGIAEGEAFRSFKHGALHGRLTGEDVNDILKRRILDRLCAWLARNGKLDHPLVKTPVDPDTNKPLAPLWTGTTADPRWVRARFTSHVIDTLRAEFDLSPAFDPRAYSAHGMRVGFVTAARADGQSDFAIKKTTRHKSDIMIDRYTYSPEVWRDNATEMF